ncbi:MAG TPA: cytochrome B6, partial [Thermodesulfobacteriota bacterium]|nr:cytochrome B6 [Thermodesulfobacteriota bacterium]
MSNGRKCFGLIMAALLLFIVLISVLGPSPSMGESSYSPVVIKESFEAIMVRMKTAKPEVMKRQMDLLNERYD